MSRNSNIEFLRFAMMVGLCISHILKHGYGLKNLELPEYNPSDGQLILMGVLMPIVDCFVFISGYFGLRLKAEKIIKLLIQASFYYILCVILRNVFNIGEPISLGYFLTNILPITNYAWWFLIWYIFLMVISPIIEEGINQIGAKRFKKILIFLFVINSFGAWLNRIHTGSDFVGLLMVYLLGRYIRKYYKDIKFIEALLLFTLITFISVSLILFTYHINKPYFTWNMLMLCNPLVILQAVALFFIVKGLPSYRSVIINHLGSHCFAIYLLTEFTDNQLYFWWINVYNRYGILLLLLSILSICISICAIDFFREKVCTPIFKYSIRLYNNYT